MRLSELRSRDLVSFHRTQFGWTAFKLLHYFQRHYNAYNRNQRKYYSNKMANANSIHWSQNKIDWGDNVENKQFDCLWNKLFIESIGTKYNKIPFIANQMVRFTVQIYGNSIKNKTYGSLFLLAPAPFLLCWSKSVAKSVVFCSVFVFQTVSGSH